MRLGQLMVIAQARRDEMRAEDPEPELSFDYKDEAEALSDTLQDEALFRGLALPDDCPDGASCPRSFGTWWAENWESERLLEAFPDPVDDDGAPVNDDWDDLPPAAHEAVDVSNAFGDLVTNLPR